MKTTGLTNKQIEDFRTELKSLLTIKDYAINDLKYLPFSGKYTAVIEVTVGGKKQIIEACNRSIMKVADDLTDKYSGMLFCIQAGRVSHSLRALFI